MSLYAVTPARRVRQVTADLLALGWVVAWVLVGRSVHASVLQLQGPAHRLERAGTRFHDGMSGASESLGRLPVVGERLGSALHETAASGTSLADAGQQLSDEVAQLALLLGLVTALVPIVVVTLPWLWTRLRFVRRAAGAARDLRAGTGPELFALRALTRQPVARLRKVAPDPVAAWRRGDPEAVRALADLELADLGVVTPARRPG
ncbi:MAG TPA: hypothetical protein VFJ12_12885 [Segeticoccus sp.]|nr:hypothetical protein [Segeticoccus sp.]